MSRVPQSILGEYYIHYLSLKQFMCSSLIVNIFVKGFDVQSRAHFGNTNPRKVNDL